MTNLDEAAGVVESPASPLGSNGHPQQSTDGANYMRQIHTDMLVNRLYGRILPPNLRAYLRRSTTPRLRLALRRSVRAILSASTAATEPMRTLPLVTKRSDGDIVIRHSGRPVIAAKIRNLTPVSAKRLNLDIVCRSFDAFGVQYFVVRSQSALRFRVAVPSAHREQAKDALVNASRKQSFYVQRTYENTRTKSATEPRLATPRSLRHALADSDFRIIRFQTDPTRCLVLSENYGCEIEFWDEQDADLVAPRKNPCTTSVPQNASSISVPESILTPFSPRHDSSQPLYPTRQGFDVPIYSDITFPIDVVYTWVDGNDPEWQRRRAAISGNGYHPEAANLARFISHDELRYSLRSVKMNMPWVRNIYLVTDQQVPAWLNVNVPGLRVVDHREIFSDRDFLPTFNSHAIETQLHHVDGLAEHFIYLNDDVCIGAPMTPDQYFLANGIAKFFPSTALVPFGEPHDGDIPSSAAGKNNRKLIAQEFGTVLTHKMKHVAHALRRSILFEIEERFDAAHRATAASRLRDSTDISVTSSLHHYYAFHTGRAVPGSLRYAYFDLGAEDTPSRLRDLLARRNFHIFCLNATTDGHDEVQRNLMIPLLEAYFPVPSPYELPATGATAGSALT